MLITKLISEVNMSPHFSAQDVMNLPVGLIGFEIEGIFKNIVDIQSMYPEDVDEDYELDVEDIKMFNITALKEDMVNNARFGKYIENVELDESIKVDRKFMYDEFGAEVITKPIPSNIAFEVLTGIFNTLTKQYGFTTNHSTGFHINISNIYTEKKQPVDLLKLMLFLGESHELERYNRSRNMYAVNLYDMVRHVGSAMVSDFTDPDDFISKVNEFIRKENKSSRYLSFNPRTLENGYMEFRIAGGEGYQNNIEKLQDSANRFIRCLYIACKPELHKREYYKKIAQLMHHATSHIHANQDDSETIVSIMRKLDIRFSSKESYLQVKSVDDLEMFHAREIMTRMYLMGAHLNPDEENPLTNKSKPFFNTRERKLLSSLYEKYKDSPFISKHYLNALKGAIFQQ